MSSFIKNSFIFTATMILKYIVDMYLLPQHTKPTPSLSADVPEWYIYIYRVVYTYLFTIDELPLTHPNH